MTDDLPPGWALAKVGEVAESVQSGFASGQHNRDGKGVPHLRPMNIDRQGRLARDDMRFVEDKDGARLRRGDVLFNNTNSAELVGKTTWIDTDDELAYSNHMTRVRLPADMSPAFVAHQLHHQWQRGVFKLLCNNHVSQASVSSRTLAEEVELAIPPATEQRRIVAKIDELMAQSRRAREALDAVPALLDKLRQSILAAAFRGDLTADWRAARSVPRAASAPIEEVCESSFYGPRFAKEEYARDGVPTIRTTDMTRDGRIRVTDDTPRVRIDHEALARFQVRRGDLLVTRTGSIGVMAVFDGSYVAVPSAYLIRFRFTVRVDPRYVFYCLMSPHGQSALGLASTAVTQPNINAEAIKRIEIPIPSLEEQREVISRLERHWVWLASIEQRATKLRAAMEALDESVLAKAFRGELVPQDPTDEPASVLLERIRKEREASREGAGRRARGRASKPKAEPVAVEDPERARVDEPEPARVNESGRARGEDAESARSKEPEPPSPVRPERSPREARTESKGRGARRSADAEPADARAPRGSNAHAGERKEHGDVEIDQQLLFDALWMQGPIEKDAAVRRIAEHLRTRGVVDFQRLRADGQLYARIVDAIDDMVKEKSGFLVRPRRGYLQACAADPTRYQLDDWRAILLQVVGEEPIAREDAIRAAAAWAREQCGLEYQRLRDDGHIVTSLRSAINSAIRQKLVTRVDAHRIARAPITDPPPPPDPLPPPVADDADDNQRGDDDHRGDDGGHGGDVSRDDDDAIMTVVERTDEPRKLDGDAVLLLQFDSDQDGYPLIRLATQLAGLAKAGLGGPAAGKPGWAFYLGLDRPHVHGLTTWLGLGKHVPPKVADLCQQFLETQKHRVQREMGSVSRHELIPIAHVTADALEVPTGPDGLSSSDLTSLLDVPRVVRRPFVLARARRRQDLLDLLLGE